MSNKIENWDIPDEFYKSDSKALFYIYKANGRLNMRFPRDNFHVFEILGILELLKSSVNDEIKHEYVTSREKFEKELRSENI